MAERDINNSTNKFHDAPFTPVKQGGWVTLDSAYESESSGEEEIKARGEGGG